MLGDFPCWRQNRGDLANPSSPHKDDQGALQLGQKRPVHGGDRLGGIFVSGHEHGCGGDAPVGHGNAGIRQHPGGGGDPGHDLERNARVTQTSPLLAAATEYVRIAAFETHHLAAGAGMLDQKLIDLLLGGPLSLSAFAHEQLFAALAGKLEKPPRPESHHRG